jgi:hypothetical protein
MPSLSSLTQSLLTQISQRTTDAYLIELNLEGSPSTEIGDRDLNFNRVAFQYFPDTINDTKGINYQQKEIPGGSLPLYQWVSGSERLISFSAVFTTDVDILSVDANTRDAVSAADGDFTLSIADRLKQTGVQRRNVDIRAAVGWLRSYMYPKYNNAANGSAAGAQGVTITQAPSKLRLVLPGSGIGIAGACAETPDSVRVIMTQCDVSYEAFFPSGLPRIATVGLAFAEIAQFGGVVQFPQRTAAMDDAVAGRRFTFGYKIVPSDNR